MKNLKMMFAWITMAVVLTVGTVGANAGIVVVGSAPQCTDTKGGLMRAIMGIVVVGSAPQLAGIIIVNAPRPCVDTNGILISD